MAAASCGCFDLEDKNLYMLANSKGNILDDAELITTLKSSKVTSSEVNAQVSKAIDTKFKIDS